MQMLWRMLVAGTAPKEAAPTAGSSAAATEERVTQEHAKATSHMPEELSGVRAELAAAKAELEVQRQACEVRPKKAAFVFYFSFVFKLKLIETTRNTTFNLFKYLFV